jgi:hypothetical protein
MMGREKKMTVLTPKGTSENRRKYLVIFVIIDNRPPEYSPRR